MSKDEIRERLRHHLTVAYGLATGVAGLLLAKEQILTAFDKDISYGILYTCLLAVSVARAFSYYHAVKDELDLLNNIFDEKDIPDIRHMSLLFAIGLGIPFGASIAYAHNVLVYSIIAIVLQLIDFVGVSWVTSTVYKMTENSFYHQEQLTEKVHVLFKYYIIRPQMIRCVVVLNLFWIALLMAVSYRLAMKGIEMYASYLLLINAIAANEVVIWRWRLVRDKDLRRSKE
jgi:hypothetical protein